MRERRQSIIPLEDFALALGITEDEAKPFLNRFSIRTWSDPEDCKVFVCYSDLEQWVSSLGGAFDGSRQYNDCYLQLHRNDGSEVAAGRYRSEALF